MDPTVLSQAINMHYWNPEFEPNHWFTCLHTPTQALTAEALPTKSLPTQSQASTSQLAPKQGGGKRRKRINQQAGVAETTSPAPMKLTPMSSAATHTSNELTHIPALPQVEALATMSAVAVRSLQKATTQRMLLL
jgi:hypothetical protein